VTARGHEFIKEILPLLGSLLEGLNSLQESSHSQQMRELFIDICFRLPVRTLVQAPVFKYLAKPLVLALESNGDLV